MTEFSLLGSILLMILLLALSGFFSMAESSLFSLGRLQRDKMKKEGKRTSKIIEKLLHEPYKLIITILFADEICNVAYTSVIALTVRGMFTNTSDNLLTLVSLLIASPTLLLLGEIGPKTIGVKYPRIASSAVSYPINYFHIVLTPIRWVFMIVSMGFIYIFGGKMQTEPGKKFSREEVKALLGLSGEQGVMTEIEQKLVSRMFNLEEVSAFKIMTPNIDCFFLPSETTISKALVNVKQKGYSRIPVYGKERDNIVGILYAKDLLTTDLGHLESIESICRPSYFIPTNKRAFDLLTEFQQKRNHMAIVVDEYGRVDGIVTMEDILEELFGEFADEMRNTEEPRYAQDGEAFSVSGSTKIDEFNEELLFSVLRYGGLERLGDDINRSIIPNRNQETLGGFVFDLFGRLPQEGEAIGFGSLRFTVTGVTGKRISKLRVNRWEAKEPT